MVPKEKKMYNIVVHNLCKVSELKDYFKIIGK